MVARAQSEIPESAPQARVAVGGGYQLPRPVIDRSRVAPHRGAPGRVGSDYEPSPPVRPGRRSILGASFGQPDGGPGDRTPGDRVEDQKVQRDGCRADPDGLLSE